MIKKGWECNSAKGLSSIPSNEVMKVHLPPRIMWKTDGNVSIVKRNTRVREEATTMT